MYNISIHEKVNIIFTKCLSTGKVSDFEQKIVFNYLEKEAPELWQYYLEMNKKSYQTDVPEYLKAFEDEYEDMKFIDFEIKVAEFIKEKSKTARINRLLNDPI